jgi:methionyl-tRNA formyltransferase
VKQAALRLGLPLEQPERIKHAAAFERLSALKADAMVVVGYGQIIPQAVIDLPRHGIINAHASLLPKYRGAAPIQWAIANGEARTGVTTMQIDAGLDTGDVLMATETVIGPEETAIEVGARLARLGADLLAETLHGLEAGMIVPRPQQDALASWAPILKKEDGRIDWLRPASEIHNRVRGFQPWPGAHSKFRGHQLQVWKSRLGDEPARGEPGSLHLGRRRLLVTCGRATTLELLELQLEGRKRVPAEAFLNGQRVVENEMLGEATN